VDEKVGVYLVVNGRQAVIEYSDLDETNMKALDENGGILYWAGNTAIHIFSLSFIRDLNSDGFALPYHCARKSAYVVSSDWEPASIDVWKFEPSSSMQYPSRRGHVAWRSPGRRNSPP
jgi:UDP-N-acetylglucosamine/UDP-N-acetylgalactosamine diphosphorylase